MPDNPIARPTTVSVSPDEFWQHIRQTAQIVTAFSLVLVAFLAVGVTFDIHAIARARVEEVGEIRELRRGLFARMDSLLWKLDTQAEMSGVTNKILADALVRMRAQVQQSNDSGLKTASATTTIAREAVKQAIATSQLVTAVTDNTPTKPVVNVEMPARPAPAPIIVQAPPAVPVIRVSPARTGAAPPRREHWWRWLLPWKWGNGR